MLGAVNQAMGRAMAVDSGMSGVRRGLALLLAATAMLLAAGCATVPRAEREALSRAQYERFAGAPVDQVVAFNIDRFQTFGDNALAVWAGASRAWLITLRGPCTGLDRQFKVGFSSSGNVIYARHDAVTFVDQPSRMLQRCPIDTIRPVDYPALRAARRAERGG